MHHGSPPTTRRHGERGSVTLLATAAILLLVGMMVLSIDLGYMLSVRGQLQNGIDSAALAASAGLRVAIEPTGVTTERNAVARSLAKTFAGRNYLRKADQIAALSLVDTDITFDPLNPLRVTVRESLTAPTIFANVFNLPTVNISAGAVGTLLAVDGGAGMISGCWRPLLLPDTFFDAADQVWAVGGTPFPNYAQAVRVGAELPNLPGDYYRSRFAAVSGPRSTGAFIASISGTGPAVTSLRDAQALEDLKVNGGNNLMAQPINFRQQDYRVIDFAASPGLSGVTPTSLQAQARDGVCAAIRVGQQVRVYGVADSAYEKVSSGLAELWLDAASGDTVNSAKFQTYKYVESAKYPTPNANPRIIPVLLFNPFELVRNPNAQYITVTNIGAFYLDLAGAGDPNLYGYFFREVTIGGLALQAANAVPPANQPLLPVAVRLGQ
jgi:Flp pilus assembly protein TadG